MSWLFRYATDIAPEHINDESPVESFSEPESEIISTPYTGCAWCGDGDGNGLCASCEAKYFPQKQGGAA